MPTPCIKILIILAKLKLVAFLKASKFSQEIPRL